MGRLFCRPRSVNVFMAQPSVHRMPLMRRFAALSALLLAIALFTPRLALAHGGEHGSAAKHADVYRARVPPSAPGQPGDFCPGGGRAACWGGGPVGLAAPRFAVLRVVGATQVQPQREPPARGPPPPFLLRFSRAPPASS